MELLDEDFVDQGEIESCPINNKFHDSENGCYLLQRDNKLYHVYKQENYNLTTNWKLVYDRLNLNWFYSIVPYYNSKLGGRVYTEYCKNFKSVECFMENKASFVGFLQEIINNYHLILRPLLITPNGTQYDLHVQQMFDVAGYRKNMLFLRPLKISPNLHLFVINSRRAFFDLLSIFAEKRDLENETNNQRLREVGVCFPLHFCSTRRYVPQEFKCKYLRKDLCRHITDNMVDGKTNLQAFYADPESLHKIKFKFKGKFCEFLLHQMTLEHQMADIVKYLNFRCRFVSENECAETLSKTFCGVFGRHAQMHRMCIPDQFLSQNWYNWFVSKFINLSNINI